MDQRSWLALFSLCIFFGSGLGKPKISESYPDYSDLKHKPKTPPSGCQWCVASQGASDSALQLALDYACGVGHADCSAIQPGASCYDPNTLYDHASYAFNDYYQKNPVPDSCVFGGTATLTSNDPSTANCHYASPRKSKSPPISETPPSNSTIATEPSTGYVPEPPGNSKAATSESHSLLLFFAFGLLASLQVANYI